MTDVLCGVCKAKTDAFICKTCAAEVADALSSLPALLQELDTTIARQDVGTDAPLYAMRRQRLQLPGVHYDEGSTTLPATPWPFSWDAASLRWAVVNTIGTWARHIAETRQAHVTDRADRWLLANINSIRLDEAAAQLFDEITSTTKAIEQAIDRQDPDIYAGPCDSPDVRAPLVNGRITPTVATCGADLYARLGDEVVKCGACGCEYDLAERKKWLIGQIPDALAVTTVIANALTSLLEPVTPSMIRQMAYRCEIVAHGTGDDGRTPLYRVGDVIDVLHRRALRKAAGRGGGKRERLSA